MAVFSLVGKGLGDEAFPLIPGSIFRSGHRSWNTFSHHAFSKAFTRTWKDSSHRSKHRLLYSNSISDYPEASVFTDESQTNV